MVDVFEEVEEQIRSDRYKRMARTWLPIVGGLLALALVAALAWWGWDSYQNSRADKASLAYDRGLEALQANNMGGAEAAFAEAGKEGNGAYKSMALQERAGLAVNANNIPEAIALLDEAAKANSAPIIADTASLKAAYLVMDTGSFDDVQMRLEPLTKEGRPMRAFAQEALAMAMLQHGKPADARGVFVQLTLGQDVPDSVRQRAQAGLNAIDTGAAANLAQIIRAQAAIPVAPTRPAAPPAVAPTPAPAQ